MSDRERWIVYPLLFLSILLGARDRIATPKLLQCQALKCEALECRSVVMRSKSGGASVKMFATKDVAILTFANYDAREQDAEVGDDVSLKAAPLRETLQIGVGADGGYVTAYGPENAPALKLGHHPTHKASGLIGTTVDGEALSENAWKLIAWDEEQAEDGEKEPAGEEQGQEDQGQEDQGQEDQGQEDQGQEEQEPSQGPDDGEESEALDE